MNVFKYRGPDVNLGRFGPVKAGDTLLLTEAEAKSIRDDQRFVPLKDAKVSKDDEQIIKSCRSGKWTVGVALLQQVQAVDPS
jgi:hypothetical protein